MLTLSAKIRKDLKKKVKKLREKEILPAILYGPKIKNIPLEINLKEFEKTEKETGESSFILLKVGDKNYQVLIKEIQRDQITGKPIHVDFYQPSLKEEIEVIVPLIFEGEAPAVKELGGTLVKNISELKIKALPKKLPHEIRVNIESLKTFEDHILIKNLKLPEGVKVLRGPEEIVVSVLPPEKVEEELAKPLEEKIEEVEKIEKKPKEEVLKEE